MCCLWFTVCPDLLFHMLFLPQSLATARLSCFPSSESLCRILYTEARGGVEACLALRSGSFQSRGLPLCQAEVFVKHFALSSTVGGSPWPGGEVGSQSAVVVS